VWVPSRGSPSAPPFLTPNERKRVMSDDFKLTPAQQARMKPHVEEWVARALECRPADRAVAERGIRAYYRVAGLAEPASIEWVSSPFEAVAKYEYVRKNWSAYIGGAVWALWPAATGIFYRDVCGLDVPAEPLQAAIDVTECWWFWPFDTIAIACDRFAQVNLDDQGRLHNDKGPVLTWRDGHKHYAWHGTSIPANWIEDRASLTPSVALEQTNVELRRIACEILGWDNVLRSLPHKVLAEDPDPAIGTLVSIDLPDAPDTRYVRALCGTGRIVYYRVSREAKTPLEACAMSYGIKTNEYKPEFRT